MQKNILFLGLVVFLSGCATILSPMGQPIPSHTYVQVNPKTNIKAHFYLVRYVEKTEGIEKFPYPIYLEFNKDIILPEDTKSIYIILQLANIQKSSYTLVKKYTVWDNTPYPYEITQIVSKSKQLSRNYQVCLPYKKGTKVDFELQLFDDKGGFLMGLGTAKYVVKKGGGEK